MLLALLLACGGSEPPKPPPAKVEAPPAPVVTVDPARLATFAPLPARMDVGEAPPAALIDLGRMLYYEPRLSKSGQISCNSCHQLGAFGVDGQARSPGHEGQLGGRNSPTSYNAAGHFLQFWDGRAGDVEAQAKGPVLNPVEMAMPDGKAVEKAVRAIPEYAPLFAAAFPDQKSPITFDNIAIAIGAFERGLTTPAPWDRYLAGDTSALTDAQKTGFNTFVEAGCTACHSGTYVGGMMFQKLGLVAEWPDQKDLGRYEVTKVDADKMLFKVPSLRNITKTGPYLHDGSVASLGEVIQKMGRHQLGKELTPQQVSEIEAWLGALEGTPPADYIQEPALPGLAAVTPK